MGASSFLTRAVGKTAREAFNAARDDARYMHGHGGYTGTIAEKSSFITLTCPAGLDPHAFAQKLLNEDDARIRDKWGPAGAVRDTAPDTWLFFGWASD